MDTVILTILDTFFSNHSKYMQIFLEEYGLASSSEVSFISFLVRSLDQGLPQRKCLELISTVLKGKVENFTYRSFLLHLGQFYEYTNDTLQCISNCCIQEYGTSLSFDFLFPNDVFGMVFDYLNTKALQGHVFEFHPMSKFQDLSELGISSFCRSGIDYNYIIVDSLLSIITKSEALREVIDREYNIDIPTLGESLYSILNASSK